MEATRRHQFQRQRSARAPPPPPPPLPRHPNPPRQNPSRFAAAAPRSPAMDDDAITTLMDVDDSPRSAGFLDEEEEADMFPVHRMVGRGNEARGPLPFAGFYNTFDGADFDDADLA